MILATLIAIAIASLLRAAITAPEGFEDEAGFHLLSAGDRAVHSHSTTSKVN